MMLVAVMSTFLYEAEAQHPNASWGIYLDDRLAWSRSVEDLEKTFRSTQTFDRLCQFKWNEVKGTVWALDEGDRDQLQSALRRAVPAEALTGRQSKKRIDKKVAQDRSPV